MLYYEHVWLPEELGQNTLWKQPEIFSKWPKGCSSMAQSSFLNQKEQIFQLLTTKLKTGSQTKEQKLLQASFLESSDISEFQTSGSRWLKRDFHSIKILKCKKKIPAFLILLCPFAQSLWKWGLLAWNIWSFQYTCDSHWIKAESLLFNPVLIVIVMVFRDKMKQMVSMSQYLLT